MGRISRKRKGKARFESVGQMLWYINDGYIGRSRKWARRRSKIAVDETDQFIDDPLIQRWRKNAVPDGTVYKNTLPPKRSNGGYRHGQG